MPNPAKHPDQRHGHRTKAENSFDTFSSSGPVSWPAVNGSWHAVAKRLYRGIRDSGQVSEYQQSDVEVAYLVCDQVSRHYKYDGPMSAVALAAVTASLNDLLTTVGARRKAKLELKRGADETEEAQNAAVTSIASRRRSS